MNVRFLAIVLSAAAFGLHERCNGQDEFVLSAGGGPDRSIAQDSASGCLQARAYPSGFYGEVGVLDPDAPLGGDYAAWRAYATRDLDELEARCLKFALDELGDPLSCRRAVAARLLGVLSHVDGLEPLIEVLDNPFDSYGVRKQSVDAVARVADRRSIDALIKAAGDPRIGYYALFRLVAKTGNPLGWSLVKLPQVPGEYQEEWTRQLVSKPHQPLFLAPVEFQRANEGAQGVEEARRIYRERQREFQAWWDEHQEDAVLNFDPTHDRDVVGLALRLD